MLYMVYERFKEEAAPKIYHRLREKGRMMPEGLEYVSSWIDVDLTRCYQLMRTEDESLFPRWTEAWNDLMEFEIMPVRRPETVVFGVGRDRAKMTARSKRISFRAARCSSRPRSCLC